MVKQYFLSVPKHWAAEYSRKLIEDEINFDMRMSRNRTAVRFYVDREDLTSKGQIRLWKVERSALFQLYRLDILTKNQWYKNITGVNDEYKPYILREIDDTIRAAKPRRERDLRVGDAYPTRNSVLKQLQFKALSFDDSGDTSGEIRTYWISDIPHTDLNDIQEMSKIYPKEYKELLRLTYGLPIVFEGTPYCALAFLHDNFQGLSSIEDVTISLQSTTGTRRGMHDRPTDVDEWRYFHNKLRHLCKSLRKLEIEIASCFHPNLVRPIPSTQGAAAVLDCETIVQESLSVDGPRYNSYFNHLTKYPRRVRIKFHFHGAGRGREQDFEREFNEEFRRRQEDVDDNHADSAEESPVCLCEDDHQFVEDTCFLNRSWQRQFQQLRLE